MNTTQVMLALSLVCAVPLILMLRLAVISRRKKLSREPLRVVGRLASVEHALAPEGTVLVNGELWRARTRTGETVERGASAVRVVGARGSLLEVELVEATLTRRAHGKAGAECGTGSA